MQYPSSRGALSVLLAVEVRDEPHGIARVIHIDGRIGIGANDDHPMVEKLMITRLAQRLVVVMPGCASGEHTAYRKKITATMISRVGTTRN